MRKLYLLFMVLSVAVIAKSQLSGAKTIPGNYATIAAAIVALNAQGIGPGGVTFNVAAGYTETSADSIYLTATGTALNRIVFQKSGAGANPKITRTGAGLLATSIFGGSGDAVFIAESSDYLTIDGIDIATADAGIEYGYYLRKASGIDGCKNDTIRNCVINMTKGTSPYVIGIYSSNNFKGQPVNSATGVTVTNVSGRNENIAIAANRISNVFSGIYTKGFAAPAPYDFYDQNFTIGYEGGGNTIQNFAGNAAAEAYGIYLNYQTGAGVQYNTVNNAADGGTAGTFALYGIRHSPLGTTSSIEISNNNINITGTSSPANQAFYAISNHLVAGSTIINNNTLTLSSVGSGLGFYNYIDNSLGGTSATAEINNNTFVGTTLNASTVILINNSNASTTDYNVSGNSIAGTLQTSANLTCYVDSYTNDLGVDNIHDNNFSNIILTGGTGVAFKGILSYEVNANIQNIYNNTVSNITGNITGTFVGIEAGNSSTKNVYGNKIFSISTAGDIDGIYLFTASGVPTNCKVYKNRVSGLSTSGTASQRIRGIILSGAINFYNNIIGDFNAPAASSTSESIIGITINNDPIYNSQLYYNTLYLNGSSSGANFSTTGLLYQNSNTGATGALDLRNNILVNTYVPGGTGLTIAFKRSISQLTNYALTSNNNLFYAGAPNEKNLIHYDGTNSDQTLAQYKSRVSPRDASSVTEIPPFLSTSGSSPLFLHINPAASTQVSNAGAPISGYTDDFDGDPRNTITPDIGADEFQVALPVTLANLQGERRGEVNKISWITFTEVNNSGFELQRSANGNTFSNIGFVSSKASGGNSTTALPYSFDDAKPGEGTSYYRLQQVDKDGRFTYSNIVFIKGLKTTNMELLNVYPNPAITSLNIIIALPANDKVSLMITDLSGKIVMQKVVNLLSGENNLSLNVSHLSSGSYYLKLVPLNGSEIAAHKFVKQ